MIHIDYREVARVLRNGKDLGPATEHLKERLTDRDAFARSIDAMIAGRLFTRSYEEAVRAMPHAVDRLDLLLLRRQGVHAAAAIRMGVGMGRLGLKCDGPDSGAHSWVWPSHQPTRGGKVVEITPTLARGITKRGRTITIVETLPMQIQQALPSLTGRPLPALVSHPVLDALETRITRAFAAGGNRFWVSFTVAQEDVRIAELAPEDLRPIISG